MTVHLSHRALLGQTGLNAAASSIETSGGDGLCLDLEATLDLSVVGQQVQLDLSLFSTGDGLTPEVRERLENNLSMLRDLSAHLHAFVDGYQQAADEIVKGS